MPTVNNQPLPQQTIDSQIPQNVVDEIVSWLVNEIQNAQTERADLTDKLIRWERMYEAVPEQQQKSFPWPGASNLEIPTIATAVESVHSRIINSIFGARDVWSAVARAPKWETIVEDIARWINWVGKEVLHLKPIISRWILSTVKFGTGIIKETWQHQQKHIKQKGTDGGVVSAQIDTHVGPVLQTIPLADFYVSNDALYSGDIQNCEWVAERQLYTMKQLTALETSGQFSNTAEIEARKRTVPSDMEDTINQNVGTTINIYKDYEIWEVHCSYDIDGDGVPEELLVNIHLDTRTVLRAILNPYYHQERPYQAIRYMARDNSFYGIGVCQMLDPIQTEISSIHNRRLDNATLSNTTAFKRVRGARTGPLEFYPGVTFDVAAKDDIEELQVGQKHVTLLPEELNTNAIGEKRTGVSDYTVGRESAAIGSRATATSTLALIKEGNVRFKYIIDEVRDALSNIAHQTIMLYQQNAPEAQVYYEQFPPKNAAMVRQFLTLPQQLSRAGVLIDVPAITEAYNKDVQRQTYMTLMQVLQQFYNGLMQAFQLAVNPQVPPQMRELAAQGAVSASKIWKRVLDAFDIVDSEALAPDVETLLGLQALGESLNGLGIGAQAGNPQNGQGQLPMGLAQGPSQEGITGPNGIAQNQNPPGGSNASTGGGQPTPGVLGISGNTQ